MTNERSTRVAGLVSVVANAGLTISKVWVGLAAGSEALLADGIHSAIDIAVSVAALSALSISYRPADDDHPYGHGKAEDLASALVSLMLFAAGLYIIVTSVSGLMSHMSRSLGQVALYVGMISLVTKELLYRYTARLGNKHNSPALKSLAEDHRTDIWGSWAALVGVGGSLLGHYLHIHQLSYADPMAAFFVGILIIRTSYKLSKSAINALMERNVGQELLETYTKVVMSVPDIMRVDRLRARSLGHYVMLDVRVSVSAEMTIQEGHDIVRVVKSRVMEQCPEIREVLVHLNPYYE